MSDKPEILDVSGTQIAVRHRPGGNPGLVWLGGYRSDMLGTKAERLDALAGELGLAYTRHDYSGHGESGGKFTDGTISTWLAQSIAVFEKYTGGPQILIGSSMGGWVALRMVQELNKGAQNDRIAGLVLLAPAPDFTVELMEPELTDAQRADLENKGYFEEFSEYSPDDPNIFTKAFFDDGRENRVLTEPLDTWCPVHILQGMADPDVPYMHAQKLMEYLGKDDATLTLVRDGDHRLSRPQDLDLLARTVTAMAERVRKDG